MITIPLSARTIPGLDKTETKALVFIVQEWSKFEDAKSKLATNKSTLDTNMVSKHLRLKHPEAMRLINRLRNQGLIFLKPRLSGGITGYGWGGSLYGALTPAEKSVQLVEKYMTE